MTDTPKAMDALPSSWTDPSRFPAPAQAERAGLEDDAGLGGPAGHGSVAEGIRALKDNAGYEPDAPSGGDVRGPPAGAADEQAAPALTALPSAEPPAKTVCQPPDGRTVQQAFPPRAPVA